MAPTLVPYGDWIIGWSGGVLSTESDFYEVVESDSSFTEVQLGEVVDMLF